jgi:hypothetical protein
MTAWFHEIKHSEKVAVVSSKTEVTVLGDLIIKVTLHHLCNILSNWKEITVSSTTKDRPT